MFANFLYYIIFQYFIRNYKLKSYFKQKARQKDFMETDFGKSICEILLKKCLISQETVESFDMFQLIVDDLISAFPKLKQDNPGAINTVKQKLGKMLSKRAKVLKFSDQKLKKLKKLLFDTINKKIKIKLKQKSKQKKEKARRKLKIGKNRQIYSSDQSEQIDDIKQEQERQQEGQGYEGDEQTIQIKKSQKKKKIVNQKKKYKIYDNDFKEQVCEFAIQNGTDYAIQKYKLSHRKISSWLEAHKLNILGKGRKALDPAMEFNMCVWILNKIWNHIPLTQKIIRQKAATMKTMNISFNGSKGWLEKFFLRHVELKSCFDVRTKQQMRQECARYHRSAFVRILKDYETLLKVQSGKKIIQGDLNAIIYKNQGHPILKLQNDKNLDKQRFQQGFLYDYQKLQKMPIQTMQLSHIKFQASSVNQAKIQECQHYNEEKTNQYRNYFESQEEEEEEEEYSDEDSEDQSVHSQFKEKQEENFSQNGNEEMNIYEEDESQQKNGKCVKIQENQIR